MKSRQSACRNLRTEVVNTFDDSPVSAFAYDYDAAGRRIQRLDGRANPPDEPLAVTNIFAYNQLSELTGAVMPALIPAGDTNTFAYQYDPIGNRQLASANEVTNLYQANELNQYTNINQGAVEPVYDLDGNMTQLGPWAYDWDGENRLISVSSNGVPVVQNQYDYMSRRIMKATATQTNTFLYDGWNLIRESIGAATPTSRFYAWGLDLSGALQGAGGVGGLLMVVKGRANPPGEPHFPSCDANGNITDLVDTNGAVVAHYEYDPFGNTVAQSGDQADANPFRFSSKYWDGETGFYYYGYRFYNPALGRWLSRDPLYEIGSVARRQDGHYLLAFGENAKEFSKRKFNRIHDIIRHNTTKQTWSIYDIHGIILSVQNEIQIYMTSMFASASEPNLYIYANNKPVQEIDAIGLFVGICIYYYDPVDIWVWDPPGWGPGMPPGPCNYKNPAYEDLDLCICNGFCWPPSGPPPKGKFGISSPPGWTLCPPAFIITMCKSI